MSNSEKQEVLAEWKTEFHNRPEQKDMQLRDSWLEKGQSMGKGKTGISRLQWQMVRCHALRRRGCSTEGVTPYHLLPLL